MQDNSTETELILPFIGQKSMAQFVSSSGAKYRSGECCGRVNHIGHTYSTWVYVHRTIMGIELPCEDCFIDKLLTWYIFHNDHEIGPEKAQHPFVEGNSEAV